ncbi:MAG TPA: hypothetical protein DCY10_08525 [Clostridiales bacterium]|jgi:hypothetical protein|nr:hypothetical protein [Clostridiales bacterium]
MNRDYDYPAAFASLQASINFGQFGCANLTPDCHAVCLQRGGMRDRRPGTKKAPARATGFSAYLSGRLQRT